MVSISKEYAANDVVVNWEMQVLIVTVTVVPSPKKSLHTESARLVHINNCKCNGSQSPIQDQTTLICITTGTACNNAYFLEKSVCLPASVKMIDELREARQGTTS